MDKMYQADYVAANTMPFVWDATTFGAPRQTERHLTGWSDFRVAWIGTATATWPIPFPVEMRKEQRPAPITATSPSEASIFSASLDATEHGGNGLMALEMAAEMGNERAFVQAANGIDWSQRSAADFARAVRLALAAGAHLLARNLADHGHRLHPRHEELAKMAHILAPPRIVRTGLPPDPTARLNLEWLREHAAEHRGQWVALKNGRLLAAAPSVRQLRTELPTTKGIFLGRVP